MQSRWGWDFTGDGDLAAQAGESLECGMTLMIPQATQKVEQEEDEEEFYMLQPANKSDRMCHLVAMTMRSSCSSSL